MNCEQVEERLSAYLDNMLAPVERREVTIHLQTCPNCMALLAELRQNDLLLARLPRISPVPALREHFFALPEMRELSEAASSVPRSSFPGIQAHPPLPSSAYPTVDMSSAPTVDMSDAPGQSRLLALPGSRGPQARFAPWELEIPPTPPTVQLRPAAVPSYPTRQYQPPRGRKGWFLPAKIALAAVLIVAVTTATLFGLSLRHQSNSANLAGAITPPAGPLSGQSLPLAAGSRFVFLRAGALWSTLADGSKRQPERLTSASAQVAAGWIVNPPQGNHDAGDLLAYIDLRGARVHTIRSDSQQDTPVPLALLPGGTTANWQSVPGQTILRSLAWSPDSSLLAFAADPTGSGQTALYLFTLATGEVHRLAADLKGSAAQPAWSPDGTRLAFTLARNGVVSVLDYNVQDRGVLDLSNLAAAQGNSADGVVALSWFSNAGQPGVTWALGSTGHISAVWVHRVGANGSIYPQRLVSGIYLQASYSPGSNNQTGGWLLVASVGGQAGDVWRLNLAAGYQLFRLSQGKQVGFACWSPDGSSVFYIHGVSNGLGKGHLVNVVSGVDQLLPDQVVASPVPDWSVDNLQVAYSTGTQVNVVSTLGAGQFIRLHLRGQIANLSWSPTAVHQLIISLAGPNSGLYLIDPRQNTALQLDSTSTVSTIQWTQIP
ncbi:MAG TPA: zf-HC2 domain-containing protein [Ktedonobacteraceae bacterium]